MAFLLVALMAFGVVSQDCAKLYETRDSWGTEYDDCDSENQQQSPVDLSVSENPWKRFLFIPAYVPVTGYTRDIEDCAPTYTVEGMGYITTSDTYALTKYYGFTARKL